MVRSFGEALDESTGMPCWLEFGALSGNELMIPSGLVNEPLIVSVR